MSCYGDELAMLEDMIVAVNDLRIVQFKIVRSKRVDEVLPTLSGNRQSIVVAVPLYETLFTLLPKEIQVCSTVKHKFSSYSMIVIEIYFDDYLSITIDS